MINAIMWNDVMESELGTHFSFMYLQSSSKRSSVNEAEKKRKERLDKIKAHMPKEKELRPSVSAAAASPKKGASISGSLSSIASSVSSVQVGRLVIIVTSDVSKCL